MSSSANEKSPAEQIADLLQSTRAVPMPGGHGYRARELRERLPHLGTEPPVAVRCYACLIMLGADESLGKWFHKGWLPFADAWFDQHAPELANTLKGDRWPHMIEAMANVAATLMNPNDCQYFAKVAADKIRQYLKPRGSLAPGKKRASTSSDAKALVSGERQPKPATSDSEIDWNDLAWKHVASLLESDAQSDTVLMLYAVHTMHSSIGVPQHSMDNFHKERIRLYEKLVEVLESMGGNQCSSCDMAQRIAGALKTTRAYLGKEGQPIRVRLLEARLPACFQPAHPHSSPPTRAGLARKLAKAPKALALLLQAHDVGELLADRIIDPVSISLYPTKSVLSNNEYLLLLNLLKDGPRLFETRGALPVDEDMGVEDSSPIKRSALLEHIASQNLPNACNKAWEVLQEQFHPQWVHWSNPNRCALCLAPSQGGSKEMSR